MDFNRLTNLSYYRSDIMKTEHYTVTLTNGATYQKYEIYAFSQREAIILAQAEAIKNAKGYELSSISMWEDWHESMSWFKVEVN
jgi:predicted ATP-grasp superfamily ATP-dependent carboligase